MELESDYSLIMKGACAHDSVAITKHNERYRPWLRAIAKGHVGQLDHATDIVEDLFVKVHMQKKTCAFTTLPEAAWRKYLKVATRNRSIDILRKLIRERGVLEEHYAARLAALDESETSEANDDSAKKLELIKKCSAQLPPRIREAFELRTSGMSSEEVAKKMGIRVEKVYVYYSQAMKAIKNCIEGILT